jgi:hypothetical protein
LHNEEFKEILSVSLQQQGKQGATAGGIWEGAEAERSMRA